MFDVLDSVVSDKRIEEGIWHHIYKEDADGGHTLLYLDAERTLPCEALVRSNRCAAMRKFQNQLQAKSLTAIRRQKVNVDIDAAGQEIEKGELESFGIILGGLRNCDSANPGEQLLTPVQAMELAAKPNYQWLVEQVTKVSKEDSRYGVVPGEQTGSAGKKALSPKE